MSSIKEIAQRAKVSIGTVDRVLHNRGRVAEETEDRVRQIIKELNYKTNIFASTLKLRKTFTFGVLMPHAYQDNEFWQLHVTGIDKAQEELEGYKVQVVYFHYDRTSEQDFITVGKRALRENLDGLVIAPLLSEKSEEFLKEIPQSLPFVFIDSKIVDSNYISSIGQEPFQSGVVSARLMKMLLPQHGKIAIVRVVPKYYFIEERIRGFLTYLRDYPQYSAEVFDLESINNREESDRLISLMSSRFEKKFKGLYLAGGHLAHFADSIAQKDLKGDVQIIGYDLNKRNKDYLKDDSAAFIISQRSEIQGYQGIYALYNYCVLKQTPERDVQCPIDVVMKENCDFI